MRVAGVPFIQGRNYSRDGDGRKYAIAIHNTSNTASAEKEASYATRRMDDVSSHFYADNDTVIQSLDITVKAWHAGSTYGNENAIAVEITGLNAWTRDQWISRVNWTELGRVLGIVCQYYGIPVVRRTVAEMKANPKVKGFYSHDAMRAAWGGTTHTDPGPNFPWDILFKAVSTYIQKVNAPVTSPTGPTIEQKIHALYTAMFYGGNSCGDTVPVEYRVSPDSYGNAIVDKINYLTWLGEQRNTPSA